MLIDLEKELKVNESNKLIHPNTLVIWPSHRGDLPEVAFGFDTWDPVTEEWDKDEWYCHSLGPMLMGCAEDFDEWDEDETQLNNFIALLDKVKAVAVSKLKTNCTE